MSNSIDSIRLASALIIALSATSAMASITEYPVSAASANPDGPGPLSITSGPDGNLWFTESTGAGIGKIDVNGNTTVFLIPGPYPPGPFGPIAITSGPDGNLWSTDPFANRIDRITPSGAITTFSIPTANSNPYGITNGPDGNLWFTEKAANKIGTITPAGSITEFTLPTSDSLPTSITSSPDGNLWFIEATSIAKITPSGVITEVYDAGVPLSSLVASPSGDLWITAPGSAIFDPHPPSSVIRINSAGMLLGVFGTPTLGSSPNGIALTPDGNFWFSESGAGNIARITQTGVITEFPIGLPMTHPVGIATGPDGNIWFADRGTNSIGKLIVSNAPITIDGYLSGNWFDPAQSGQGFQLEFTDQANTAVAIWFTFAPDGSGQKWIYAQGSYDNTKNTITLPAVLSSGAKFPPNFKSSDVTKTPWGTITFTFTSCTLGTVSWNSTLPGYGTGSLPISRLTSIKGTTCP